MYRIKQVPEDFIVREISDIEKKDKGLYCYYIMKKRDYTTSKAIHIIASRLRKKPKEISFAGTKDRKAVTEQMISIRNCSQSKVSSVKFEDISLEFFGMGDSPLQLGDLTGNRFEITIRNIIKKPKRIDRFVNIFGEQRFSSNNHEIGRSIIKKEFKKAVGLILENKGEIEQDVSNYIKKNKTDHIGAIRTVPKMISLLYVHAYQSLLWNKYAEKIAGVCKENISVPIFGFGTELQGFEYKDIVEEVLNKEGLAERDFIVRQIPGFSCFGSERKLFAEPHDLEISSLEDDEMNKGKKKCMVKFWLDKGTYATIAVDQMSV